MPPGDISAVGKERRLCMYKYTRGIRRKRHISILSELKRKKTVSEIWVYLMLQRTRVQRFSTFRLVHSISIVIYSIRLGFSFGM